MLRLRYKMSIVKLKDQIMAVPVGYGLDGYNGFLQLNTVGLFLFEELQKGITEEALVQKVKEKYNSISEETIRLDVSAFLKKLNDKDMLIEEEEHARKIQFSRRTVF